MSCGSSDKPTSIDEVALVSLYLLADAAGGVMVDVGAHCGGASLPFLKEGWRVYAFEPDPVNRGELEKLAAKYPALHVDERAVSDREGRQESFYSSPLSQGISGLTPFHESHQETGKVDTVTLSAFCNSQGVTEVDLLKTDTEGHDLLVLRGHAWERIRPRIVISEFEDSKTRLLGYTFHDLAEFLVSHGYELLVSEWYPIEAYGRPHAWKQFMRYPCEPAEASSWGNIIAFRDRIDWLRLQTASVRSLADQVALAQRRLLSTQQRCDQLEERVADLADELRWLRASKEWRMAEGMGKLARRGRSIMRRWKSDE